MTNKRGDNHQKAKVLYELIYDKMYEVAGSDKMLSIDESKIFVARAYNVPYKLWYCILRYMEDEGWIVKESQQVIRVIKEPPNVLENANKYYQIAGLF